MFFKVHHLILRIPSIKVHLSLHYCLPSFSPSIMLFVIVNAKLDNIIWIENG